jgi:thioredoxin-related protein
MKAILLLIFIAPILLPAQVATINARQPENSIPPNIKGESSGIIWVTNLNWQQVLQKAKKENKYIFVDCYTTWCKPCKQMDIDVYANDSVGNFLNTQFISVKVQMDSTKNDNEFTRSWHKTAKKMGATYRVAAYPTFLFFSPNGEVVYKEFGYKAPDKFMQVARDALTPSKQYYALLRAHKKEKKDYRNMLGLIMLSKQLGDTTNYYPLLKDYYSYLQTQGKDKLYTKENIEFIASTLTRSNQPPFNMFYPDGSAVDNVMNKKGFARKVVDQVILKEKANPFLSAAEGKPEPDWSILHNAIAKDYKGDYADRLVLETKLRWYQFYGNISKLTPTLNEKMEKYGSDTTSKGEDFKLNNMAFIMFKEINDVAELKRIINWMAGVVRRGEKATDYYIEYWPLYLDTYANLLYKVGETQEAIKWQELAVTKSKELKIGQGDIDDIQGNLEKMKKGEPTWPTDSK